jgi:hypothetical protein
VLCICCPRPRWQVASTSSRTRGLPAGYGLNGVFCFTAALDELFVLEELIETHDVARVRLPRKVFDGDAHSYHA